jgi:hypothetical protein
MEALSSERTTGTRARSPVEWYCLLTGLALLVTGLWALALDGVGWETTGAVNGPEVWGLFEANGWHAVLHIAAGLVLLAAIATRHSARMAAMASGVLFGAMAARGLVDGNDVIGLVAVNAAANWLHAGIAALGFLAYAASAAGRHEEERTGRRGGADPGGRFERARLQSEIGLGPPTRR